jgi:hypothetical protein
LTLVSKASIYRRITDQDYASNNNGATQGGKFSNQSAILRQGLPTPAQDVYAMRFSANGTLFVVLKRQQHASLREHKVTILSWERPAKGYPRRFEVVDTVCDTKQPSLHAG